MKNIKVLGLAIIASVIAAPAFAGETYVRNEWTDTSGYTNTNLNLNSDTVSKRNEWYDSSADKIYVDGDVEMESKLSFKNHKPVLKTEVEFDDYSVHTAGSSLSGDFFEKITTNVNGTIQSYSEFDSHAHETSAGVR